MIKEKTRNIHFDDVVRHESGQKSSRSWRGEIDIVVSVEDAFDRTLFILQGLLKHDIFDTCCRIGQSVRYTVGHDKGDIQMTASGK